MTNIAKATKTIRNNRGEKLSIVCNIKNEVMIYFTINVLNVESEIVFTANFNELEMLELVNFAHLFSRENSL